MVKEVPVVFLESCLQIEPKLDLCRTLIKMSDSDEDVPLGKAFAKTSPQSKQPPAKEASGLKDSKDAPPPAAATAVKQDAGSDSEDDKPLGERTKEAGDGCLPRCS